MGAGEGGGGQLRISLQHHVTQNPQRRFTPRSHTQGEERGTVEPGFHKGRVTHNPQQPYRGGRRGGLEGDREDGGKVGLAGGGGGVREGPYLDGGGRERGGAGPGNLIYAASGP